jgi:hypothetical protein
MVERVLTHCATDRKAAEPLLVRARRSPHVLRGTGRRRSARTARARPDRSVNSRIPRVGKAKRAHHLPHVVLWWARRKCAFAQPTITRAKRTNPSCGVRGKMDCFVAFAPCANALRLSQAMTESPIPPGRCSAPGSLRDVRGGRG